MKRYTLLLFFALFVTPSFCNQGSINTLNDSTYFLHMRSKIDSLSNFDPAEALILAYKVKSKATETNDIKNQAYLFKQIADIYLENTEYSKALENLQIAINIYDELINTYPGDKNIKAEMAKCINNIGAVYFQVKNYQESLIYSKLRLNLTYKLNDKNQIGLVYANLAVVHNKLGNIDSALYYCRKAIHLYNQSQQLFDINQKVGYMQLFNNYATISEKQHKNDSALYYYNLAEEMCLKTMENNKKHIRLNHMLLTIYNNKALYFRRIKHNQIQFFHYMKMAEKIIDKYGFPEIAIEIYSSLKAYYKEMNDFPKAYYYLSKYVVCMDSLEKKSSSKQIMKMEMQVKFDKWKTLMEMQSQKEKGKYIIGFILLISITIISFLLFFWKSSIARSSRLEKESLEIKNQHLEIQHKTNEKELDYQKRELRNFALHISLMESISTKLQNNLKILKKTAGVNVKLVDDCLDSLMYAFNSKKEREKIFLNVQKLSDSFFYKLKVKHPDLTTKDINLAAMIRLELSSKEIAIFMKISERSVNNYKFRLKCKLNINEVEHIKDYLICL